MLDEAATAVLGEPPVTPASRHDARLHDVTLAVGPSDGRARRSCDTDNDTRHTVVYDRGVPGPVITTKASILCTHGGRVVITPRPGKALAELGTVLCEPDLVGASILGCTQAPSQSTKPCTSVIAMQPGSTSAKLAVGGRPAYLASLVGTTDGVPPGTVTVADPGQTHLVA